MLLRSFEPGAAAVDDLDVPDPYYGDESEFAAVLEIIEPACHGLFAHLRGNAVEARWA